ncbi:HD domain-containing phosphohydrolase [Aestuariispira insulae]|uniref:Putative nucleotidyltransferase with HDIG domain n=1 Tax=Aestuariispira insulae TaxID=1461337 RepID=A0A3D9HEI5_9PROT|nr:HD domain-containing phosphohydrolase [Aestuariispira insulae]RED47661.1 putative nucleotidyltransferase with HDIG domain [Aestuariispira insulae]
MSAGWDKLVADKVASIKAVEKNSILLAAANPKLFSEIMPGLTRYVDVTFAEEGWTALEMAKTGNYIAAIIDEDLPGLSGFDVARRLKREPDEKGYTLPVMLVARRAEDHDAVERIKAYCDGYMLAPFEASPFLTRFWEVCDVYMERAWDDLNYIQSSVLKVAKKNLIKLFDSAAIHGAVDPKLSSECSVALVKAARSQDLNGVLTMLKNHHSYSFCHALKVSALMALFGEQVGLKDGDLALLAQGGLVHDVGKAVTAVHLLDKPTVLDEDEWEIMRQHVEHSGRILRASGEVPREVIHIAERHHEKIDGTGYPYGLKGAQMDDPSLIAMMMDIYSALTDKRSYKKAFSKQKSMEIMASMAGHHIEPGFFERFREMVLDGVID